MEPLYKSETVCSAIKRLPPTYRAPPSRPPHPASFSLPELDSTCICVQTDLSIMPECDFVLLQSERRHEVSACDVCTRH